MKLGADPTGELHVGHALPLMILRLFQRRGHDIHFIVGDFTARIGDPSGRSDRRRELSTSDITRNTKHYVRNVSSLIDTKRAHVHRNSKWLSKTPLAEFFNVGQKERPPIF